MFVILGYLNSQDWDYGNELVITSVTEISVCPYFIKRDAIRDDHNVVLQLALISSL